jgi:hypothetical protein
MAATTRIVPGYYYGPHTGASTNDLTVRPTACHAGVRNDSSEVPSPQRPTVVRGATVVPPPESEAFV